VQEVEIGIGLQKDERGRAFLISSFQRVERLFEQGRRERALRKDPDQALPVFLMAAAKGMLQREVYGLPALEPDRAAKSLVKLFLEGAGP